MRPASQRSNLDKVLRWLVLQAHGAGDEPDAPHHEADAAAGGGHGRLWRLWESLGAWRRRKQRSWGGRAGFTVLATSLISAEA